MSVFTIPPPKSDLAPALWLGVQWFAIHTNVNQEKRVAESLQQRGIEFFLPLYQTIRRRSDRRVSLSLPLFPGYLFVRIPSQDRRRVLQIPRVVRLVGVRSEPSALPDEELDMLRNGLSGQVYAEPCRYLTEGCRVRVVSGPFEGAEGIFLKRKTGPRVVLSLHVIQRAFMVEVGESDIERI